MTGNTQSCFYTTADGLQCHYLLWPNSNSDSCCLFLHGFTNDAHIWDYLAVPLQQQHNVVAVDFRGHGDSDWDNEARYTHEQLCDDVRQLMQQLPFTRFHIIGHSLGARIAMLMLARHTLPVTSLTIIDTGPEVRAVGVNKVRLDAESAPTRFENSEQYFQYLSGIYLFAQPERLRHVAEYGLKKNTAGEWITKTDPAFTSALWKPGSRLASSDDLRYPLNEELWDALAALRCRCLLIRGQASAILSRQIAEKMVSVMRNARLVTVSRAGHALMVDNPAEFEQAVLAFVAEQPAAATGSQA